MWKFYKAEYTKHWFAIPFGVRADYVYYRSDIEKELVISILCWHFRFWKFA